jgi:hypothetical protein
MAASWPNFTRTMLPCPQKALDSPQLSEDQTGLDRSAMAELNRAGSGGCLSWRVESAGIPSPRDGP